MHRLSSAAAQSADLHRRLTVRPDMRRIADWREAKARISRNGSQRRKDGRYVRGGCVTALIFTLQPKPHPSRDRAAQAVLEAPDGHRVRIEAPRKSRLQEEKYHAQINDIARQYVHAGRKWDAEDMKRLLVDAFRQETKGDPDFAPLWAEMGEMHLVPAIGRDGFVALGIQTRKFPKKLASAFVEWLNAFGAENDIVWSDPKDKLTAAQLADPVTGEITEAAA